MVVGCVVGVAGADVSVMMEDCCRSGLEQRVAQENSCVWSEQGNGGDGTGGVHQSTPSEQGDGSVSGVPASMVASSDTNGHAETQADGTGRSGDVGKAAEDVVLSSSCARMESLGTGEEEGGCGTEAAAGRVEGASTACPDVGGAEASAAPAEKRGGADAIKKAVSDYVVQLLTPLYKTRRIQKEDFKAIVKKSTAKVRRWWVVWGEGNEGVMGSVRRGSGYGRSERVCEVVLVKLYCAVLVELVMG